MPLAAIALGSNLGDRAATLHAALARLGSLGIVQTASRFYETDPVGYLDQPSFLNAAALLETSLLSLELMRQLLAVELEFGRDRSHGIAKGPRTLDLDLLLYGDLIVNSAELTLPHPEMHRRRFVLEPLAEIAPDLVHASRRCTVAQLLARLC